MVVPPMGNQKCCFYAMEESTINCPECTFEIDIDGGEIGDFFECDTCACPVVIKSLNPAKVDVLVEEK